MPRNLNATLAAALADSSIVPVLLVSLAMASGTVYVWSGLGNLTYNGNTYQGVGALGKISEITENSDVQADGISVMLSGIPIAGLTLPATIVPGAPSGLSAPVTIPTGQQVAWALPTTASTPFPSFTACGYTGTAVVSLDSGFLALTGSFPTCPNVVSCQWGGYSLPTLPPGSVIEAVYAVVHVASGVQQNTAQIFSAAVNGTNIFSNYLSGSSQYSGQFVAGGSLGSGTAIIEEITTAFELTQSLMGGPYPDQVVIDAVALAVYYTPGTALPSLATEAASDLQLGAPANIYFGLLSQGALVGAPYLIFSGQVDQPTIEISDQTFSVTLALENRLVNMARPTSRRYTAADQHLAYPDDIGFNWVEILSDMALRWGIAK
jgi:hypothetical protein